MPTITSKKAKNPTRRTALRMYYHERYAHLSIMHSAAACLDALYCALADSRVLPLLPFIWYALRVVLHVHLMQEPKHYFAVSYEHSNLLSRAVSLRLAFGDASNLVVISLPSLCVWAVPSVCAGITLERQVPKLLAQVAQPSAVMQSLVDQILRIVYCPCNSTSRAGRAHNVLATGDKLLLEVESP